MSLSYDVYINSGGVGALHLSEGSNISQIQITNSDQDYYQNGVITYFKPTITYNVGDTVMILIDDSLQFDGYIARRQRTIDGGVNVVSYQLVGKTYDLWRYKTDTNATYTGYTGYIASSLVKAYAPEIGRDGVSATDGIELTEDLDLTNISIGEALVTLTNLDGYKFYVDTDDNLQYYEPSEKEYVFTVTESEIFEMTPIEEADEDLVNDVLVVGGSGYSSKTNVSSTHPSSIAFPSGIMVAQSFTSEGTRLNAVKLYLDRSIDPNQPDTLPFEIWRNASATLFTDTFDNWNYIQYSSNIMVEDGYLKLAPANSYTEFYIGGGISSPYKYHAQTFQFSYDVCPYYAYFALLATGGYNLQFEIRTTSGDVPTNTILCSGEYTGPNAGLRRYVVKFNKQIKLAASTKYALVVHDKGLSQLYAIIDNAGPYYTKGDWCHSDDDSTWSKLSNYDVDFKIIGRVYKTNGIASSNSYKNIECQYMDLVLDGMVSSSRIYLSGSNSGSKNWQTLTDSTWYDFGFEYASGTRIKYKLSSNGYWTPKIGLATVYVGDSHGSSSAIPLSGSKMEWSNDISFTASDIPYPPSYSAWQTYTSPKLQLDNNTGYWMIMHYPSSAIKYWKYYYDSLSTYDGKIAYSWDDGVKWSTNTTYPAYVPNGNMTFQLGWSQGNIVATAENQTSIDYYGRHFRKITDSTITTLEAAQARADAEVEGMEVIPKKGTVTINGRTDMSVDYAFSSNFSNFGIAEKWDVVSYTQSIDNRGFTTTINYNKHLYDITQEIANLQQEVYG